MALVSMRGLFDRSRYTNNNRNADCVCDYDRGASAKQCPYVHATWIVWKTHTLLEKKALTFTNLKTNLDGHFGKNGINGLYIY